MAGTSNIIKTHRSISHAGFPVTEDADHRGNSKAVGNGDTSVHKSHLTAESQEESHSTSSSILNMATSNENRSFLQTDNKLSFHPLKSYKTGNISESALSISTEIGPVFTTQAATKKTTVFYTCNRNNLLDCKPIRASKSTLDLPSLAQQEELNSSNVKISENVHKSNKSKLFLNTDSTTAVQQQQNHEGEYRKRSLSNSPEMVAHNRQSILVNVNNHANHTAEVASTSATKEEDSQSNAKEKPKKKRSFRIKSKTNKEKDNKDKEGSPKVPSNVKRKGSAPSGKGAPEINIDKCDDDPEPEEDGDEEPRIGSLEWCRRRSTSSAISGLLVCTGEIGPAIAVGLNIGSSIVTSNGTPLSASDQLYVSDANLANIVPLSVPMLPMTVEPSDSSDTEAVLESELRKELPGLPLNIPDISADGAEAIDSGESSIPFVPPVCPVDHSNIGKELMNCIVPCNIDQLFTMLFTNSKFYLDFQLSRKTCDMNQSDWQLGEESHKTRQLTFTVTTGQNIGPKQVQVTETQTLLPASTPGLLYAIESESVNAGIPYADAFSVKCHYCLAKYSSNEATIAVISKIHYKKSIWAAKPFIEKNSMAALVDYFNNLDRALKEECAKMNAGGITPTTPIIVSNFSRRRPPRKKGKAPDIPAAAMSRPMVESGMVHHHHHHQVGTGGRSSLAGTTVDTMTDTTHEHTESSFEMKIIMCILACLVLLNVFLFYKLSWLETATTQSLAFPPISIHFSGEPPQNHQEWLVLLQKQEILHRTEVQGWHEILASAIKILRQAEKDLEALKAHIITYGKGSTVINPVPPDSASDSEKPKQVNPDETPTPPPQNPISVEKTEKDENVKEL